MNDLLAAGRIIFGADEDQIIQIKEYLKEYKGALKGVIELDSRVGANELENLFGSREVFRNPKPVELLGQLLSFTSSGSDIVMDFFAGSGTFGQATISLNRDDGGKRRFLIVDMGEYFDEVLGPRVIKAMYAFRWDGGKPIGDQLPSGTISDSALLPDWVTCSPRLVKVLRLESFEDSLNALELPEERTARMQGQMAIFGDDYLLKYLLPIETEGSASLLNADTLEHPFAYALRVHTNDGLKMVPVDLVETANLLLGLHVQKIRSLCNGDREYRIVEGLRDQRNVLVVWRDVADLDPVAEVEFLQGEVDLDQYDVIYTNADSALPKGQSIDPELKRLMLERDRGTV
jgi:adenine-specific DNA-methyltransferase